MKIIENFLNPNKYSLKAPRKLDPLFIVVHNTGNDASARNEIAYMIRNNSSTSFHFAVDDKEIVQGVPLDRMTHNCGYGYGNLHSISIEICYSKSGGERFIQAEKNACKLIAMLLKKYGWTMDQVKTHQMMNGKYCPHRTLDMGWQRFLNMIKAEMGETQQVESKPSADNVNVKYCVKTKKYGWLPFVENLNDYAGWKNDNITDIAIKVDKGTIKYRVHVLGGSWLPFVTQCNLNDHTNGYAGVGKTIDCIEIYYNTPSDIRPFKKAKYRVNGYDWQYDNEKTAHQDGYAGVFGIPVTTLQIEIV